MSAAKQPSADELLVIIRAHCLECCGGSKKEVERCRVLSCRLRPYRTVAALNGDKKNRMKGKQVSLFEFMEVEE